VLPVTVVALGPKFNYRMRPGPLITTDCVVSIRNRRMLRSRLCTVPATPAIVGGFSQVSPIVLRGIVQHQLTLVLRSLVPPGTRKANDALLAPGSDHPPSPSRGLWAGK